MEREFAVLGADFERRARAYSTSGVRGNGLATGVADGIRTRDHRDHNPGLYRLSYRHRAERG
jgi:hypothetical protein